MEILYEHFPAKFQTYIEPFAGSFCVVLNLPVIEKHRKGLLAVKKLPSILVNDIDDNIIAIALTLLLEPDRLYKASKIIYSQGLKRLLLDFEAKDTFQKAVVTLYLLKTSFGSMIDKTKSGFNYQINSNNKNTPFYSSREVVKELHERLCLIKFFNETWSKFLNRFKDKANDAFIYLDPPYYDVDETIYRYGTIDHKELRDYLSELNPKNMKWLLSYDNCQAIRDLYSDFYQFPVTWNYTLAKSIVSGGKELLISNYDPFKDKNKQKNLNSLLLKKS